jgi:hypothetical protein
MLFAAVMALYAAVLVLYALACASVGADCEAPERNTAAS